MEKHLEAIIVRRVYDLIRSKAKGHLIVKIEGDTLDISIEWKNFQYGVYYPHLSSTIMYGDFFFEKVTSKFIEDWKYYITAA